MHYMAMTRPRRWMRKPTMSSTEFGWESLLDSDAPSACVISSRACSRDFDRADAHLLAEHLLPALFKLNRESDSEGKEREYFPSGT